MRVDTVFGMETLTCTWIKPSINFEYLPVVPCVFVLLLPITVSSFLEFFLN